MLNSFHLSLTGPSIARSALIRQFALQTVSKFKISLFNVDVEIFNW